MISMARNPSRTSPAIWMWRLTPVFCTAIFIIGLGIDTINIAVNHPNRLYGGRFVGLVILLSLLIGAFQWFTHERIFRHGSMSDRYALFALAIQIFAMLILVWAYDISFAWFSLSLPYQIIGGLSQRHWPLTLTGMVLILVIGVLPRDGNTVIDIGSVVGSLLLFVTNLGIAVFIRLSSNQRDQLHTALKQLQQAHASLEASAAQGEELAVLRERTRLARLMHDDLGHALVAVNINLEAAQLLYEHDPAQGAAQLETTRALIRNAMAELRHTLTDLRAPMTHHDDLAAALHRLAQETQARTRMTVTCIIAPALPPFSIEECDTLWYLVREALINVERHTTATRVSLTLESVSTGWLLRVIDDGPGITQDDLHRDGHYGVIGMRERVCAINGTFSIECGASGGTIVEAHFPITTTRQARLP